MMIIRKEQENDHRKVEELTREAFWNIYEPGTNKHLFIHKLRKTNDLIKELCLVAVYQDQIVGNITYSKSIIINKNDNKTHEVVTFGPISVLPALQRKGIGAALIKQSIKIATEIGYKAIVIKGYRQIYKKFGFQNGKKFGICAADGSYPKWLLVIELYNGALNDINGVFIKNNVLHTDPVELEDFDKKFPFKEKLVTESQEYFKIMVNLKYEDPDP